MDQRIELQPKSAFPVACTLSAKDADRQLFEWVDLQGHARTVIPMDGGVRLTFPASLTDGIRDLARREAACCAFLAIETTLADDELTVEISSDNPDALPVISALAGIELSWLPLR